MRSERAPHLGPLLRNVVPWLQKSRGDGEPEALQTRRTSPPREKAWAGGPTSTDGASKGEPSRGETGEGRGEVEWRITGSRDKRGGGTVDAVFR